MCRTPVSEQLRLRLSELTVQGSVKALVHMQIPPSLPPESLHHYVVSTSVHNNARSPSWGLIAMFNTDVSLSPSLIFFSIYLTFLCRGGIRLQEERLICAVSTAPPATHTHTHTHCQYIYFAPTKNSL